MIVNALTSIGASFIIAFYFSWKLTLVIMCFLPLLGLSGVLQAKMLTGFENKNKKSMEEAGQVMENLERQETLPPPAYLCLKAV